MRFSTVLLALAATAFAQDEEGPDSTGSAAVGTSISDTPALSTTTSGTPPTVTSTSVIQHFNGVAGFLTNFLPQLQLSPEFGIVAVQLFQQIQGYGPKLYPQATTIGDLQTAVASDSTLALRLISRIPRGVLDAAEYQAIALDYTNIVKVVNQNVIAVLNILPEQLNINDITNYVAANDASKGGSSSQLLLQFSQVAQTAVTQAIELLGELESVAYPQGVVPSDTACGSGPTSLSPLPTGGATQSDSPTGTPGPTNTPVATASDIPVPTPSGTDSFPIPTPSGTDSFPIPTPTGTDSFPIPTPSSTGSFPVNETISGGMTTPTIITGSASSIVSSKALVGSVLLAAMVGTFGIMI